MLSAIRPILLIDYVFILIRRSYFCLVLPRRVFVNRNTPSVAVVAPMTARSVGKAAPVLASCVPVSTFFAVTGFACHWAYSVVSPAGSLSVLFSFTLVPCLFFQPVNV